MAKKPSGFSSQNVLASNFENLRDGFDNTLSLDGSTPNAMGADLDLNNNDIINVSTLEADTIIVNGDSVAPNLQGPAGADGTDGVDGASPKAHHSLSVLNAPQAALQRFNLTKQGTGSGNVIQGFASDPYTNELFTLHVTGDPDTCVLNKFEADGKRNQTSSRYNSTPLTTLGHQELEISWDKSGARWFWTGENEAVTNQARYIKRFQIADGSGTELTVSNVQQFQVFTDAETTGVETGSASTCISLDGRYLVTEYSGSDTNRVKVFKTATLMNGGAGDYSTQQVYSWTFDLDTGDYPLQSTACDGSYVYIFTGK